MHKVYMRWTLSTIWMNLIIWSCAYVKLVNIFVISLIHSSFHGFWKNKPFFFSLLHVKQFFVILKKVNQGLTMNKLERKRSSLRREIKAKKEGKAKAGEELEPLVFVSMFVSKWKSFLSASFNSFHYAIIMKWTSPYSLSA